MSVTFGVAGFPSGKEYLSHFHLEQRAVFMNKSRIGNYASDRKLACTWNASVGSYLFEIATRNYAPIGLGNFGRGLEITHRRIGIYPPSGRKVRVNQTAAERLELSISGGEELEIGAGMGQG